MKKLTSVLGILFLGSFLAGFWTSPVFATPTLGVDGDNDGNIDRHLWVHADLKDKTGFNGFTFFWNTDYTGPNSRINLNYTIYWPLSYNGDDQYYEGQEWSIPVNAFSHFHSQELIVKFWLSKDDNKVVKLDSGNDNVGDFSNHYFRFEFYEIDSPYGITKWRDRNLLGSAFGDWKYDLYNGIDPSELSVFFTMNNLEYVASNQSDFMPIPEPSTWLLLASGLGILLGLARRKTASVRDQL